MAHPHLSERDARLLTHHVVEELRLLGAVVRQAGVAIDPEHGLIFLAEINGRMASCRTGGGVIAYRDVAIGLLAPPEALLGVKES